MKLLIDIPDKVYNDIHSRDWRNGELVFSKEWKAIHDGIPLDDVLDKIRAEILEEKECVYADFDKYKVDYLGVDSRYVEDELPYDDFRYGMERCIEIIDKYRNEVSDKK